MRPTQLIRPRSEDEPPPLYPDAVARAKAAAAKAESTRKFAVGLVVSGLVALITGTAFFALASNRHQDTYGRFGAPFDVEPHPAGQTLRTSGAVPAADTALLAKLTTTPTATWFGPWNGDIRADVAARVDQAAADGKIAVLVTYELPHGDCGSGSPGMASSYRTWIRQFAAGLGHHRAVVIVEPDAIPLMDCLNATGQRERVAIIKDSVQQIERTGSWAYIDAGHSAWKSASVIASRLKAAGIAQAAGFSLNVANYQPTNALIAFGSQVSALTGGKHFVLDTGRNGRAVAGNAWCNASGAGLGARPTTHTASPLVDAYLWIKTPGSSDGTCNGGPPAGVWWPSYARMLATHASF